MKATKCKHCGQVPFESIETILGDQFYILTCRKCKYGIQVPIEKRKSDSLADTFTHIAVVSKQREKAIIKWNELNDVPENNSLVEKLALSITPIMVQEYDIKDPDMLADMIVQLTKSIVKKIKC